MVCSANSAVQNCTRMTDWSQEDVLAAKGERSTSGGWKFTNADSVKRQRDIAFGFAMSLPKQFLDGKDLVSVSLPVALFEARSFLERITDNWCHMGLMRKAAAAKDPLERLKLVIAFAYSGLCNTCRPRKPFNPILGETYQGRYSTGEMVFCEQASHHPPVSLYTIQTPDGTYSIHGSCGWTGSFRGNSIRGHQTGQNKVTFADGSEVEWNLPYLWLHGIAMGERIMNYEGPMTFVDVKNGIFCNLVLNPDNAGGGMIKSIGAGLGRLFGAAKKREADSAIGEIYAISRDWDGTGVPMPDGEPLAALEGCWLEHLDIDGKRMWTNNGSEPRLAPSPIENPLPSDCRFREDLQALKEPGDSIAKAQEMKEVSFGFRPALPTFGLIFFFFQMLEQKQRADKNLRKAVSGA